MKTLSTVPIMVSTHGRGLFPKWALLATDGTYVRKGALWGLLAPGAITGKVKFTPHKHRAHRFDDPVLWGRKRGFNIDTG